MVLEAIVEKPGRCETRLDDNADVESKEHGSNIAPHPSNEVSNSPRISVHISPGQPHLSAKSNTTTKINITFILQTPGPITIFVHDTILCPASLSLRSVRGEYFDFVNEETWARHRPPHIDYMLIIHPDVYRVSFSNSARFLTLYTGVLYQVQRALHPRSDDDLEAMQIGLSYRMKLKPDLREQRLWWAKGRRWQVLNWGWWPFASPSNLMDFEWGHKGWEDVPMIHFDCDDDCVFTAVA